MVLGFECGKTPAATPTLRRTFAANSGRGCSPEIIFQIVSGSDALEAWNKSTLRLLILPGGVVLACAAVLAHSDWVALPGASLNFLSYCALTGGMLLAWRFHSSRVFLALLVVCLFQEGLPLLAPPHSRAWFGSAVTVLGALVPLDFLLIGLMREQGFSVSSLAPPLLVMFVQSTFVAVLAAGNETSIGTHHPGRLWLPTYVLIAFAAASLLLLARALRSRKPSDGALFWSLAACFLSLYFHPEMRASSVYALAALSILAISVIETSYLFAYHDELTGLPSRRAFNDSFQALQVPYSVAAVDIDHFKSFNDTYGHDVGDEVLRLVASKLARITGGGRAYRCGGEEFTILFSGKLTSEVLPHLEELRLAIENAHFRKRGSERRQTPRGPDRRSVGNRNRTRKADAIRQLARDRSPQAVSVTVSVGVATCSSDASDREQVLLAADKALYRAKANGRNRIEIATSRRSARAKTAGIA
jgi:diguanylate cyclase (GGDEF)-like protein